MIFYLKEEVSALKNELAKTMASLAERQVQVQTAASTLATLKSRTEKRIQTYQNVVSENMYCMHAGGHVLSGLQGIPVSIIKRQRV